MKPSLTTPGVAWLLAGCVILAPRSANADSVDVPASRDNTLYFSPAGLLSNGAGEHFFVGRVAASALRRGLLRFDVAVAVPIGAQVTGVTLHLTMSRTAVGPTAIGLHRALADWGEGTSHAEGEEGAGANATAGDATWIHRFYDSTFWSMAGGDFAALPSATQMVDAPGVYDWATTSELVADVQSWLNSPAANFGWVLVADETTSSAKRFDTRENVDPAARPRLTIEYRPPCVGDLNHDGSVGLSDLTLLLSGFGVVDPPEPNPGDVDGDGDVDLNDLAALLSRFGMSCP